MFASEKVMLDYLGQLLNEELPKTPAEVISPDIEAAIQDAINEPQNVNKPERSLKPIRTVRSFERGTEPQKKVSFSETLKPKVKPQEKVEVEFRQYKEPEPVEPSTEAKAVEKLLQQVSLKQQEEKIVKEQSKTVDLVETKVEVEVEQPSKQVVEATVTEIPEEPFQALFFEVAGLVLAVPLQELGGIHNLTEVNSLFGKPSWFHGVMINREKKLNVVDSARWVMPEKYDKNMEESLNYQYLIMLDESSWGLAAEKLVETELIHPDAVKWRTQPGKRPWLLGTIKEKMCALLHVGDLIAMLEQGVNARQE